MTGLEAGLRSDMARLEASLRSDMTRLDAGTDHKLHGLEGRLSKQIAESTRQVVLSMLFLMLGVIAAIAASINLS